MSIIKRYCVYHFLWYISKIINKLNLPSKFCRKINDYRHGLILNELTPYFNKAFTKIKNNNANTYPGSIIWVFWWQGVSKMPMIVSKCINSIYYYSNNHRVVLITKYNIKRYANIPAFIYNKVADGDITLTHFSDILRFNLLYHYGGLWIDSTVYCVKPIPKICFSPIYTSGGYSNKSHFFVSTKWTGFLFGGYKHSAIFQFMNYFFQNYWQRNKFQIDYFLIDYALDYVYMNNIGCFKQYVDNYSYKNNPCLYKLWPLLNKKFNKILFNKLIRNTTFFKLTYRKTYNVKRNTFLSLLINSKY